MLHTETVTKPTLELLKKLQAEEVMHDFNLAGGTSLALYLGHRTSIDLDMFTPVPFDTIKLEQFLLTHYGFHTDFMEKNTLKGTIDGIKVDCITYPYRNIKDIYEIDGIRLYSMEDMAAMKLSAVADDGSRLKDFVDIAFLSVYFSLYSMLQFYEQKFPKSNVIRPLKAITYFDDIDFEEDVITLQYRYDWRFIEKRLLDMMKNQNKVFKTAPLPFSGNRKR